MMLSLPGGKFIGPGSCFIIAEAGVNHNGDMDHALALVDAAADAGADAVKFQTYITDLLVSSDSPKAAYQLRDGSSETQYDMLKSLELSKEDHSVLQGRCVERDIIFLSTPFDSKSADFLNDLSVPVFKIGSGDVTNLPLIAHVASFAKPVILSTGMCDLDDIRQALAAARSEGNSDLLLMHCVSSYPAACGDVNLRAIETMKREFGLPVGYSDHTEGLAAAVASVGAGACIVEKHFTLSRDQAGPDHAASVEPDELRSLVRMLREAASSMGDGVKQPVENERRMKYIARRSIVAAHDIREGSGFIEADFVFRRPAGGMDPGEVYEICGRKAACDIPSGTEISSEMIA